ncbi:hypothetical protein LCL97_00895 [Seohaeicola saemankumensis]|nr:hypothetical protein [Seohaeicola saemankumensis]MCA0869368.1 hypothetical protein [Seohaeicola saemankumensis]
MRDATPAGLVYPATGQWPDGAHHKLSFALQGRTSYGTIDIPDWDALLPALIDELDHAIAQTKDVVISSELLTPELAQTFLARVLPALATPFDKVTVIVVLRHPLERAASSYNQQIKDQQTDEARMPNVYLKEAGEQLCLMPLITAWQRMDLPVIFLNYHPSRDLVQRFLDLIGFGHAAPPQQTQRRNASMNGFGLTAMLCARRLGLDIDQRNALFDTLRANKSLNIWNGPSFPFAEGPVRQFLNTKVAADLQQVKQETGLDVPRITAEDKPRFRLGPEQVDAIRDLFSTLPLNPGQVSRLDNMLGRLE